MRTPGLAFTSVDDLGRLIEVVMGDLAKFRTKTVLVVSQKVTPLEMLRSWNNAVGLRTAFKSLSTEEYKQRLKTVHNIPNVFAVALAENLSVYRDDPEAWADGTDSAIQDLVPNLKTWEEYVKGKDWDACFKSVESAA